MASKEAGVFLISQFFLNSRICISWCKNGVAQLLSPMVGSHGSHSCMQEKCETVIVTDTL